MRGSEGGEREGGGGVIEIGYVRVCMRGGVRGWVLNVVMKVFDGYIHE